MAYSLWCMVSGKNASRISVIFARICWIQAYGVPVPENIRIQSELRGINDW